MSKLQLWALAWLAGVAAPVGAAQPEYPPPLGPYEIPGASGTPPAPHSSGAAALPGGFGPPYGGYPGRDRAFPGYGPLGTPPWAPPSYPWPPHHPGPLPGYPYPGGLPATTAPAPLAPDASPEPAGPAAASPVGPTAAEPAQTPMASDAPDPAPQGSPSPEPSEPLPQDQPAQAGPATSKPSPRSSPPEPHFRPWSPGEPAARAPAAEGAAGPDPLFRPGLKAIQEVPRPEVKRTEEGFLINGEPPVFRPLPPDSTPKTEQQTVPKAPAPDPVEV